MTDGVQQPALVRRTPRRGGRGEVQRSAGTLPGDEKKLAQGNESLANAARLKVGAHLGQGVSTLPATGGPDSQRPKQQTLSVLGLGLYGRTIASGGYRTEGERLHL